MMRTAYSVSASHPKVSVVTFSAKSLAFFPSLRAIGRPSMMAAETVPLGALA